MIFTGDISIPIKGKMKFRCFPKEILNKNWIGNLEGSLVDVETDEFKRLLSRRIVFNNLSAIREMLETIPFCAFGLANNHLLDACCVRNTQRNLEAIQKSGFGAGSNIGDASEPLLISDEGVDYALFAFGSRFVKCIDATNKSEGSNPYNHWYVLEQMQAAIHKYPERRMITFMHWNTELELYPQPLDRELSHKLIDLGVYAVVGCHAHRVQPIEFYKGHPIVYGLGNFSFVQNVYMSGNLKFPFFSYREIALEILVDGFAIHHFTYDPTLSEVRYISTEDCTNNAIFSEMSNQDYKLWFKKNRVQRKGTSILYYSDTKFQNELKFLWSKTRGMIIDSLAYNQKLFNAAKKIATWIYE